MSRQVALLRGVNVGGRGAVPMAPLRELFTSLGLDEVTTYLQSGNVLFAAGRPVDADRLQAAIAERFGVPTDVVLRTADELAAAVAANPFPGAGGTVLHIGFCATAPAAAAVASLAGHGYSPEEVAVVGRDVYYHLPGGMGTAKLPAYVARRLGVPVTVRNWRTVTALAAKAAG